MFVKNRSKNTDRVKKKSGVKSSQKIEKFSIKVSKEEFKNKKLEKIIIN